MDSIWSWARIILSSHENLDLWETTRSSFDSDESWIRDDTQGANAPFPPTPLPVLFQEIWHWWRWCSFFPCAMIIHCRIRSHIFVIHTIYGYVHMYWFTLAVACSISLLTQLVSFAGYSTSPWAQNCFISIQRLRRRLPRSSSIKYTSKYHVCIEKLAIGNVCMQLRLGMHIIVKVLSNSTKTNDYIVINTIRTWLLLHGFSSNWKVISSFA